MLESLNDISYTIPYLNATITKDVVLEYAKTHAENGGPVFSIVLLVLFMLIMTLVWIYLALCAFCRTLKRAATPRVSPRPYAPGESPASPSRSSVPLRNSGGKRSAPAYFAEDEGGVEMGGAGGPGGTPRSPYGMRRTASWERERRRYSFKCLYVCSGLFSAFLLVCVLGVFASQSKFDGSVRTLARETEDFILATADALCTSSETAPEVCMERSAGKFVGTAENQTTSILTDTLGLIVSLDDRVLPYINSTIDELTAAKAQLNAIYAVADRINANVTEIEDYRNWLLAIADPAVGDHVPEGPLPNVTADQLQAVDDAMANVEEGIARASDVYANVADFVATELPRLEGELNPDNGTTARQLLDPLERVRAAILDARGRAMRLHEEAEDGEEMYGGYLTQKTWGVSVVFLLPLLLQVVLTLLNRSYTKCSGHLVANMCCAYFCLLLFTLCALVFSALATVSSTVCEYHLQAIDRIPPRNISLDDQQLEVTPQVIRAVLACPAGPVATPDNNFVSLLKAEALFNVTDEAEDAILQIDEARGDFSPEAQIRLALIELEEMGNSTNVFNATEATADLPVYRQNVTNFLDELPPDALDRRNKTQRDILYEYYLAEVEGENDPPFSWTSYGTGIEEVNAYLATATTPLPEGFAADNDFQTMHNFTRATVQQHLAAWQAVEWTGTNDLAGLRTRLAGTDPYTDAVNRAEAKNVEVRANLTQIDQDLAFIELEVGQLDAAQEALTRLRSSVNNTLHALLGEVQVVEGALDAEEEDVRGLAAYVGTAPEYAKCGFVGDFYKEGFQQAFCGDFHSSASVSWPFMLGAAFCLFVSFLTFSCFVRKPQWYLDAGYENDVERNALSPGRTPHGGAYVVA